MARLVSSLDCAFLLGERAKMPCLLLYFIRAFVPLFHLLDASAIVMIRHIKQSAAEKQQPLLRKKPRNVSMIAATPITLLGKEGGCVEYLQAFSVFLYYLFSKDNCMVMGALVVRSIHVLHQRTLNPFTLR
jgi:hypothetical protein